MTGEAERLLRHILDELHGSMGKIGEKITLQKREIMQDGQAIAETRFPWWFENFGLPRGWKRKAEDILRENEEHIYVLGRFFKRLVLLDTHSELKPLPWMTKNGFVVFGWFTLAICITNKPFYPEWPEDIKQIGGSHDWNDYMYI